MFSSRVEHRLSIRGDNADIRLTKIGSECGLVSDERYLLAMERETMSNKAIKILKETKGFLRQAKQWRKFGCEKCPDARHGRLLSPAEIIQSGEDISNILNALSKMLLVSDDDDHDNKVDSSEEEEALRELYEISSSALELASTEIYYENYIKRQSKDV